MQVSVEGFTDNEERELLREFAHFCADFQCGPAYTGSMTVRIVRDMGLMAEQRWADAQVDDPLSPYPSRFTIRLLGVMRGLNLMQTLRLLGHEMTHVKQFVSGQLQFLENDRVRWGNQRRRLSSFKDWLEPWEMEARACEKALVERFCKERDYYTATWYRSMP